MDVLEDHDVSDGLVSKVVLEHGVHHLRVDEREAFHVVLLSSCIVLVSFLLGCLDHLAGPLVLV